MAESHCPLCYTELTTKDVTPCMECGSDELELDHYETHVYRLYELYFGQRLLLCDFCAVDFGSYKPAYLSFTHGLSVGYEDFQFVKEMPNKHLRKGKYCPICQHLLPFLRSVQTCRERDDAEA